MKTHSKLVGFPNEWRKRGDRRGKTALKMRLKAHKIKNFNSFVLQFLYLTKDTQKKLMNTMFTIKFGYFFLSTLLGLCNKTL